MYQRVSQHETRTFKANHSEDQGEEADLKQQQQQQKKTLKNCCKWMFKHFYHLNTACNFCC